MGPTPPGTGVMQLDRYRATSNSLTSPVIVLLLSLLFSSSLIVFIPTSITQLPSLIHSPLTTPLFPTATTRISASLTTSFRFVVKEWHSVTVALRFVKRAAIGFPTSLLRPITTALFPSILNPVLLISSTQPRGVQGMRNSSEVLSIKRVRLRGCKPSTSLRGFIWLIS